jgi:hypothetical protein
MTDRRTIAARKGVGVSDVSGRFRRGLRRLFGGRSRNAHRRSLENRVRGIEYDGSATPWRCRLHGFACPLANYQRGAHVINVFSWANNHNVLPKNTTRNGYHVACWNAANLLYCAVSDTAWNELLQLKRLLRVLGAGDEE